MARVLIVPCGCRGQALARDLVAAGHAVRGVVYEPALPAGERIARDAAERWRIPVEVVEPGGARLAVDRLLGL